MTHVRSQKVKGQNLLGRKCAKQNSGVLHCRQRADRRPMERSQRLWSMTIRQSAL